MYLQLLGPVEATLDGRPVTLGATKQRALLSMLALEANAAVPVDRLVDGLWGDDPPATAAKMVQLYVSQLRRALAGDDACIVTHGRGYELRVADDAVDAARFQRLVENGSAREALGLWHGAALADVAQEPFAGAEIRRLEELRLTAAENAVDADLAAGRDSAALAELERLIAVHPLRERLHARRMLALYRAGRQAEALDAYVTARARLVDDVGVEPAAELRELHDRILRQDPALRRETAATTAPAPAPATAASPAASRAGHLPGPRALLVLASVLVVGAAAVFAITRLTGSSALDRIDEGAVGVIDPGAAAITAQYHVTAAPQAVVGGAGSVWVANPAASTVTRIGADRKAVTTMDVGGSPSALAFGGGSLWVADEDRGDVVQVDPAENRVVQRIRVGNGLRALAVGHGALWIAAALDGEVVRMDLRSGHLTHIAAGGLPVAVAVGRDAVWAATEESGRVVRIDPRTSAITDAIDVGNGPSAVAVGEGAVWAANRQDGTVSRIDPATDREIAKIPAGRAPSALAIAHGAVWVADAEGGMVGRLDPERDRIADSVTIRSAPAGLAAIGGAVWATAAAPAAAHRGGTLRIGRPVFDFDPAKGGYDPSATPLLDLAYDGLVHYRRASGAAGARLVPGLAVDVPEPTDGGRRYVFRLRRGGRYSDGTPVRAGDVRASIERMLMIQGRELPPLYDAIVGAAGCGTAAAGCDLSHGIVADERSRTVTFHLRRPDPELRQKLTLPLAVVVPASTPRRASTRPVPGTGPYRVTRVEPVDHGRRALLTRNPRFRPGTAGGRAAGFADRVEIDMDDDEARQIAAFERGELDITGVLNATAPRLAALRTRFGTRLRSGAYAKTVYAWMNVHAAPFDDRRVRRALDLAVDRRAVVDSVGGPVTGSPTCQLLPSGFAGYRPTCPFTTAASPAGAWVGPDRARAKALVAASGRGGTRVAVWTPPPWRGIGRELASDLRRLGFRARVAPFAGLSEITIAAHDPRRHPQIGLMGWIADWPEPAGFLRALISCAADTGTDPRGVNLSQFCDNKIDSAIAGAEGSGPAAGAAWQSIEERIADQAPVVPLMNGRFTILTSERTGNVQFHPLNGPLYDAIWVR